MLIGLKRSRQMDRVGDDVNRFTCRVQTFTLPERYKGKEQAHFPTVEGVNPNPAATARVWKTDDPRRAMLSLLGDRYAVTKRSAARKLPPYSALRHVHGVRGFVARNVCPEDRN
jgi:hypothetical protein